MLSQCFVPYCGSHICLGSEAILVPRPNPESYKQSTCPITEVISPIHTKSNHHQGTGYTSMKRSPWLACARAKFNPQFHLPIDPSITGYISSGPEHHQPQNPNCLTHTKGQDSSGLAPRSMPSTKWPLFQKGHSSFTLHS